MCRARQADSQASASPATAASVALWHRCIRISCHSAAALVKRQLRPLLGTARLPARLTARWALAMTALLAICLLRSRLWRERAYYQQNRRLGWRMRR